MKKHTKELAQEYRATERTITRWRSDGAPLGDAAKMRQWLSTRKHLPEGTRAWLLEGGHVSALLSTSVTPPDTSETEPVGASNALRRLEQAEAASYSALKKAMRGGDPFEIKLARESWLKIGDSLRRYDLLVDATRRATGQLVNREQIEERLKMFASFWQLAWSQLRTSAVPRIVGEPSMERVDQILEDMGNAGLLLSLAGYVEWNQRENPKVGREYAWILEALRQGFEEMYHPWAPAIEARRELWKKILDSTCAGIGLKSQQNAPELTPQSAEIVGDSTPQGAD